MTACSSSTKQLTVIDPPADLVQPCGKLPELSGTTGKLVLPWVTSVVDKYNDCAKRHDALVKAWPK